MGNNGLPKLLNSGVKRICPGLCPFCTHYGTIQGGWFDGWEYCDKLEKRLSNPHTTPGKCTDFERGEQKCSDEYIEQLHQSARDTQEDKRKMKEERAAFWAQFSDGK